MLSDQIMESRKIISLGKVSSVVSLPREWLELNGLKRGDMLTLMMQRDGSLSLYPSEAVAGENRRILIKIKVDETPDAISRKIIGCFLGGYITIELSSEKIFSVSQQKAIRNIVGMLYMMIVESEASKIVLRTLIDESRASVVSGIERMHIITFSMCRDILVSFKDGDIELVKSVIPLEDDVDQLSFLLRRLIRVSVIKPTIAKELGLDPIDALDYQTLVHRIERIADHVVIIANNIVQLIDSGVKVPEDIKKVMIDAFRTASDSYDKAVGSFLSKDLEHVNDIINREEEIESLVGKIDYPKYFHNEDDISFVSKIIVINESIRKVSHYAAEIAELTIDQVYKFENTVKNEVSR